MNSLQTGIRGGIGCGARILPGQSLRPDTNDGPLSTGMLGDVRPSCNYTIEFSEQLKQLW